MSDSAHRVVYKFPIHHVTESIMVRSGAKVVLVDYQDSVPTLWVLLDTTAALESWDIEVFATGEPIPDGYDYLGSVVVRDRGLVWHVCRHR